MSERSSITVLNPSHLPDPLPVRIMLIEDDAYMTELISTMFADFGVPIMHQASNGRVGLEIYDQAPVKPNLLICDLCMPEMDGLEFLKNMASRMYKGDIVLISSYDTKMPELHQWKLTHYDASRLQLAEKMTRLRGLNVIATFEKPLRLNDIDEIMLRVQKYMNQRLTA